MTSTTTNKAPSAPEAETEESGNIKPTSKLKSCMNTHSNDSEEPPAQPPSQPLYFNKDGKPQFGITPPAAFALRYPYPPLPSDIAKNRVLRPQDEQSKEILQEGIIEAEKEFDKEAMPLPGLLSLEGSPLPKVLISEIELALYWDRHPYEFRKASENSKAKGNSATKNGSAKSFRRSKSDMNLLSEVGSILKETRNTSKSSSLNGDGSNSNTSQRRSTKSSRSRSSSASSMKVLSQEKEFPSRNAHNGDSYREQSPTLPPGDTLQRSSPGIGIDNQCTNGKCSSTGSNSSKGNQAVLQMSESERKKFDDIKLFHQQHTEPKSSHQGQSPPKLIRSHEQLEQMRKGKKSEGVQVTLEDVTTSALKSTYLCPLHGQYRRGVERREKSGFRTDMSSLTNVHAYCSRALKGRPCRTKLIKTAETQTDEEGPPEGQITTDVRVKRSKTAGHTRCVGSKGKDMMLSEYHGSFKNPYKIAESEKRHLRNKILNYCFTKHSIF